MACLEKLRILMGPSLAERPWATFLTWVYFRIYRPGVRMVPGRGSWQQLDSTGL